SERLEIDANSRFMVTYNSDNNIVKVCDDLEVNEFMEFIVKSSRIVTLCIVECSVNGRQSSTTESKQQSNFIHATPAVNVYQTEYHATQMHVFRGSSGLIYQNLLSYQQMHRFSKNPVESDEEGSESDEEGSESDEDEETTPVENKNCKVDKFYSMPPLLKTPVFDLKKKVGDAIRIFMSHIRPLIIIDGAHLKGKSSLPRSGTLIINKQQLALLVGTKLQHVVSLLALDIVAPRGPTVEETQVNPRDELFWFGKPEILLRLIQIISFQNAFEMATFIWFVRDS
nr:MLO-like protein 4 [Tanacetum cinerariifolium]